MRLSRRGFLKAGLAGAAALALAGAWLAATRADDEIDALFAALGAAMLDGALPQDAARRAAALQANAARMRTVVAGLSAPSQQELRQLFGLLCFAPARLLLTGSAAPWRQASPSQTAAFLENWRQSRFALLQSAYAALHDIALGAWYGVAENWAPIGYAGPPALARKP